VPCLVRRPSDEMRACLRCPAALVDPNGRPVWVVWRQDCGSRSSMRKGTGLIRESEFEPRYQSNRSKRPLWGRFALVGHKGLECTEASVCRAARLLSARRGRCRNKETPARGPGLRGVRVRWQDHSQNVVFPTATVCGKFWNPPKKTLAPLESVTSTAMAAPGLALQAHE